MSDTDEDLDRQIEKLLERKKRLSDAQNLITKDSPQGIADTTSAGKTSSRRQKQQSSSHDQQKSSEHPFDPPSCLYVLNPVHFNNNLCTKVKLVLRRVKRSLTAAPN